MNVDVLTSTEHSLTEAGLESSSSHVVPAGSVVIATRVGLGKAVILAQDTAINQDLRGLVIHDHGKVTDKFLYWWYRSIAGHVISAGTGATVQGVTLPFIASLEVPVPPLAEQHRIVAKLNEIHADLRTLSECLDAELLRSLNIRRSVASDMLSASSGQMLTLGDVVSIEIGRTPARADPLMWDPMRQSGAVWVSIADLSACHGRIISDSKEYISRAAATAGRHVRAGTLMMSFKLSIGKLAFAGRDLYTNEAIAALTIKNSDRLIPDFLFHYLSNVEWASFAAGNEKVKGATLNKAKLAVVPLPVPTLSEQQRIVARLDDVQSVCTEVSTNIERRKVKARELRQSVLAAAFRGEL
jgi:type I restriction enzyme S subunit